MWHLSKLYLVLKFKFKFKQSHEALCFGTILVSMDWVTRKLSFLLHLIGKFICRVYDIFSLPIKIEEDKDCDVSSWIIAESDF